MKLQKIKLPDNPLHKPNDYIIAMSVNSLMDEITTLKETVHDLETQLDAVTCRVYNPKSEIDTLKERVEKIADTNNYLLSKQSQTEETIRRMHESPKSEWCTCEKPLSRGPRCTTCIYCNKTINPLLSSEVREDLFQYLCSEMPNYSIQHIEDVTDEILKLTGRRV